MPGNGVQTRTQSPRAIVAARSAKFLIPPLILAAILGPAVLAGCHSLRRGNEAIVRVESKRDTPRATRLTLTGIRALHKHEIDRAANLFRKAVAADYAYGPAHNNLGLMHYEQGNLYQAVVAFEQARRWMPDDPAVLYNLGLALESAGRTDEALQLYGQANTLDPVNPNYLGNLVRLRMRLGERDDLLRGQLQELVLIETRPDWRRWADRQLALTINEVLDRGPATPDLQAAVRTPGRPRTVDPNQLRDKIIDLTPVVPVSHEPVDPLREDFERLPDAPGRRDIEAGAPLELSPPKVKRVDPPGDQEAPSVLLERDAEELTLEDYLRR